jgi:hypothetical protein
VQSSSAYPNDKFLVQRSNDQTLYSEETNRPEKITIINELEQPIEIINENHQNDLIASSKRQSSEIKSSKEEKSEATSISSELSEAGSVKKLSESIADKGLLEEEEEKDEEEKDEEGKEGNFCDEEKVSIRQTANSESNLEQTCKPEPNESVSEYGSLVLSNDSQPISKSIVSKEATATTTIAPAEEGSSLSENESNSKSLEQINLIEFTEQSLSGTDSIKESSEDAWNTEIFEESWVATFLPVNTHSEPINLTENEPQICMAEKIPIEFKETSIPKQIGKEKLAHTQDLSQISFETFVNIKEEGQLEKEKKEEKSLTGVFTSDKILEPVNLEGIFLATPFETTFNVESVILTDPLKKIIETNNLAENNSSSSEKAFAVRDKFDFDLEDSCFEQSEKLFENIDFDEFIMQISSEKTTQEKPGNPNIQAESQSEVSFFPVEINLQSIPETTMQSEPEAIQTQDNCFRIEFLHDFKVVFVIDDSETMNESVQKPILISSQSSPSKWKELKLVFQTLTEITPVLAKSEIYLLDDKPYGMNSIDKLFKIVIANHNQTKKAEELMAKNLLIIFLTDVRVTQKEFEESNNFYDTLLNIDSNQNIYASFIDFSQDRLTSEYFNILSSEFTNVTFDDLSLMRNAVEEAKLTGQTEQFQFNFADYFENFLFRSIKLNT